jgi:acetyltransferase-like isoleucine patch superfamily enzyme
VRGGNDVIKEVRFVDWDAYEHHAPSGSWIAGDFRHGDGFEHGLQCIIEPDVVVGNDVTLGHRVHLSSGTRILDDVDIADDCVTTGISLIGNHVRVRTGSCISKAVIIDDWCFVAAGIMSSHTKNIDHARPNAPQRQLVTRFGYASVIGSRTNTSAGVTIAPAAVVGYGSHVVTDLETANAVYYNDPHPWATLQRELDPGNPYYVDVPADYAPHEFDAELLARYLPHYRP